MQPRHQRLSIVLFAAAILCGLSGEAFAQIINSPMYCHQYCVDEDQCNAEFSCYDAGTQTWSNCYDYNYEDYCGIICGMQWGPWEYDHHIGFWGADNYSTGICTYMQSYLVRRDGVDPCTHQTATDYWCTDEPYPLSDPSTGDVGTCCLLYYCWGMTCSEWS